VSTSGLRHSILQVFGRVMVVKLLKQNSQSDITIASLDDMSQAKKLPRVTLIHDLHIPEMMIST
jgi:hypothetical protein